MQWHVSISFNFLRLAHVNILTYLLKLVYAKPSNRIAACQHPCNRRRRRNHRRASNTQHVNVNGMEQLVHQVATQCHARRSVSRSPEPPAYQQVFPRSRTHSRSPPPTRRCSSIFYSDKTQFQIGDSNFYEIDMPDAELISSNSMFTPI